MKYLILLTAAVSSAKLIDVANLLDGGKATETQSRSRHSTWAVESENVLNEHIALEMAAAVQYRALYAWASRDYVNLKNSASFFAESAKEEFDHAYELMGYQTKRGGKVLIQPLEAPVHEFDGTSDKADARVAFEAALAMEKKVYDSLLNLHAVCGAHVDPQCQDTIDAYLAEQVSAVDKLARYVADLDRIGNSGHAVWDWDHEVPSA